MALLGLLGCLSSPKPEDPSVAPKAVCSHIVLYDIDPSFSDTERIDIEAAADAWSLSSGYRHCFFHIRHDDPARHNIPSAEVVYFSRADTPADMCHVSQNEKDCSTYVGLWQATSRSIWLLPNAIPSRRRVIAGHEIGHMLGLEHNERAGSIMRKVAYDMAPDALDSGAIPLIDRESYFRIWSER